MQLQILVAAIIGVTCSQPVPEPWLGDFGGALSDPQSTGTTGRVFIVNNTCVQISNFTYTADAPDVRLWASYDTKLDAGGVQLPTFEYGMEPIGAYKNALLVLTLPDDHRLNDFRTLGLWSPTFAKTYGSVVMAETIEPPMNTFLKGRLMGDKYALGSGPIVILDRRTIKIYAFTFEGDRAPDPYFMVGNSKEVTPEMGVTVPIRGRDLPDAITPMNERYYGKDVIIDLPESHDIYAIKWLSVYCVQFRVDFGHVETSDGLSDRIPPFVPVQKSLNDDSTPLRAAWPSNTLVGHPASHTNFTVQLGTPGGRRAYESWAKARPSKYVLYVDGYMTPELVVQRGTTYAFDIQAGADNMASMSTSSKGASNDYYNPMYISDDPFGGYSRLPSDDRPMVTVYAGLDDQGRPLVGGNAGDNSVSTAGRLCLWTPSSEDLNADHLVDYADYFTHLRLKCGKGTSGTLVWTPDQNTPDTVYYQSYTSYNMGYKIRVMDSIPDELASAAPITFDYQVWLDTNALVKVPRSHNAATVTMQCAVVGLLTIVMGVYFVRC